jgi:hypothetical protein
MRSTPHIPFSVLAVTLMALAAAPGLNHAVEPDDELAIVLKQARYDWMRANARGTDSEEHAGTLRPEGPELISLPVIRTYRMTYKTSPISDLAFGGGFLWGLDGAVYGSPLYIDRLNRSNARILASLRGPGSPGYERHSIGLAYTSNHLWVLNFIEDRIYKVHPTTGRTVSFISAPGMSVTAGLGQEGTALWYGEWDLSGRYGGALLRKVDQTGRLLASFRLPGIGYTNDIAFAKGHLWISAQDLSSNYAILQVNPKTRQIVNRFAKAPCERGLTLNGSVLWSADWCRAQYTAYRLP